MDDDEIYECDFCNQETDDDYNPCEWCPMIGCQNCTADGDFCPACGEGLDDE